MGNLPTHGSEKEHGATPRWLFAVVIAIDLISIGCWLATGPHTFDRLTLAMGLIARAASIICILYGMWFYRPQHRLVWWLLAARFLWSILFISTRGSLHIPWIWWLVDSAAGTLVYIVVAGILVRRRAADQDRALWIDVTVISTGLLFVLFSYLGIPLVESGPHSAATLFEGLAYPILDTVLVAFILLLAFTSVKERNGTLAILLAAFAIDAGADMSGLMAQLGMFDMGPRRTFLPISILFISLIGLAALLPSMRRIDSNEANRPMPWGVPRLTLIVTAFLITLYRLATWTSRGIRPPLLLIAAVLGVMFLLIVLRAILAVNALKASHARVHHLATHDGPTGLLNMVGLGEIYKRRSGTVSLESEHSLILVRLRELREIGQLWGHTVRDELVINSAAAIQSAIPSGGVLARAGTDRFAFLTPPQEHDATPVEHIGRRIADSLRTTQAHSSMDIIPSFDIGIASGAAPITLDALMREAESAAAVAEAHGQGCIARYDAEIALKEERQFALLNLLRGAIQRRELSVVYQPIIDISSDRTAYHEALLRWTTPEFGSVSPSEFIPLAESSHVIEDITDWVLDEACLELSSSLAHTSDGYRISINISARSLQRPGLTSRVKNALDRHNLPPTAICLEITERSLTEDWHGELQALRSEGVTLAIDDFGTGYSNLAMLTNLRADTVKVDVSLVRAAEIDIELRRIIRSLLVPLHERGMSLVAEGIETLEQRALMRELGCDFGQGWLFGRPQSRLIVNT